MSSSKRPKIPPVIETEILTRSRRKCCLCYALKQDESVKQGQIAHLDCNSENNEAGNLAWLCLDHHDQYDSTTSQAKGFTIHEVKTHRTSLYDLILLREANSAARTDSLDKVVQRYEQHLANQQERITNLQDERDRYLKSADELQAAVARGEAELTRARAQMEAALQRQNPKPLIDQMGADATIRRILFFEPSSNTLALVTSILRRRGYVVTSTTSIDQLADFAEKHTFDLFIAEPYISKGQLEWQDKVVQVMAELRKEGAVGIVVSGTKDEPNRIAQAKENGFTYYLQKPMNVLKLFELIDKLASEKYQQRRD